MKRLHGSLFCACLCFCSFVAALALSHPLHSRAEEVTEDISKSQLGITTLNEDGSSSSTSFFGEYLGDEVWKFNYGFSQPEVKVQAVSYQVFYPFQAGRTYRLMIDTPWPSVDNGYYQIIYTGSASGSKYYVCGYKKQTEVLGGSRYYDTGSFYYSAYEFVEGTDKIYLQYGYKTTADGYINIDPSGAFYSHIYIYVYDETEDLLVRVEGAIVDGTQDIVSGIDGLGTKLGNHIIDFMGQSKEDAETEHGLLESISNGISNLITSIVELPQTLVNLLIDALKSLFVPEDGYFEGVLEELQAYLREHLGLLYLPIDILQRLVGLVSSESEGFVMSMPALKYPYLYEGSLEMRELVEAKEYDIGAIFDEFSEAVTALRLLVDVVLTFAVVRYVYVKIQKFGITDSGGAAA